MNGFIDRLADFLRTILGSDDAPSPGPDPRKRQKFVDPDLQEAWKELDDYMNAGRNTGTQSEDTRSRGTERPRPAPDDSLRQDYTNLEVPFGADMETVVRSYKKLIMRYHPDKHSGGPEEQRVALEITKKLNESFDRIRAARECRSSPS